MVGKADELLLYLCFQWTLEALGAFEKLALTGGLFWCLGEKKPDESGGFPSAPKFETFKSHADGADKGAGRINESGVCRFRP